MSRHRERLSGVLLALVFSAGGVKAADHFEMLPSDTDPARITPFEMLESDIPPSAGSQQIIFDGNGSAGSASLETNPGEAIIFRDDATASSASIVNNGGQTFFEDRTTAASSSLTSNEDGYLRFSGTSDAADSRIVVNGGGRADLDEDATAGSAFITNNAYLRFGGRSTAANANITVNEDGVLAFRESADAGIARLTNNGLTGFFDSSTLAGSTVINNGTGFLLFADDANAGTTSFISNNGTMAFTDRSTLGDGAITSNAAGIVRFEDRSNAGTGFISSSGGLVFTDQSSAADAEIVGNVGGLILFRDDSSAGTAEISGGSDLRFSGRSSAASAAITMAPQTTLSFVDLADGDAAQVQLDAGSSLDIASGNQPVSLASLSGAGRVSLGANTLVLGDSTPLVNFDGIIDDADRGGGLTKRGAGTINLSGQSNYSGPTTIRAGTLEAGALNAFSSRSAFTASSGATLALAGFNQQIGSLAGSGLLDLSAGSVLTAGGNNASTTFSGQIVGTGGISKVGTGEFTLTGNSSYSGSTRIIGGSLRVDGDISSSSVTVNDQGTLLGRGSVGTTEVSGTLLGEANGDALDIAGDLTLGSTAITALEISSAQSGRFDVSGVAILDGALAILPSGTMVANRQYIFLTAGLVAGTYSNVESSFAFLDTILSYGSTFAALELMRNEASFSSVGLTPNQRATGGAIERLGIGNAVFDAVLPLSTEDARTAFDNLSGEGHATALVAASSAQAGVRRAVLGQLQDETRSNVWGVVQGGSSRISSDGNGAEVKLQDTSLIGGIDILSIQDLQLGAFGYVGQSDLTLDERATWGNARYGGAGFYGGWSLDRWRVRGATALSYNSLELTRRISAGLLTGTAHSSYPGWTASAGGEVGYVLDGEKLRVEPYAGFDYSYTWTSGFSENGAAAAGLSSTGSSYSQLNTEIGVRASTAFILDDITVKPSIGVSYVRNLVGATAASTHRFSQGDDFEVYAARTARDSAAIDLRINIAFSDSAEGDLFYRGALQEGELNQLYGAAFRVSF